MKTILPQSKIDQLRILACQIPLLIQQLDELGYYGTARAMDSVYIRFRHELTNKLAFSKIGQKLFSEVNGGN